MLEAYNYMAYSKTIGGVSYEDYLATPPKIINSVVQINSEIQKEQEKKSKRKK